MVIFVAVQVTAWCDYVNAYNLAMKNHIYNVILNYICLFFLKKAL